MTKRIPARRYHLIIFLCFACLGAFPQKRSALPASIIFDSDMGPDYDDVGAIAMLHAFADSGYIKILATISSTKYKDVAGVFSVLNTYFKRPGIPVAVPRGKAVDIKDWQHWTDTLLAKYPHAIKSNDDVPDAVELYRKILSQQKDQSVTIVSVGFLTNLANLLQSQPDKYSKLSGTELVKKKVKRLVSMAGIFPSGKEFNVEKDAAASQVVFTQWPTNVVLSGFEIGKKLKVGLPLSKNEKIINSPVKDVFGICIPLSKDDSDGRMAWDETAVLVGVKGYEGFYNAVEGKMIVADDGSNTWNDSKRGHFKLIEKMDVELVTKYIELLIAHQPM